MQADASRPTPAGCSKVKIERNLMCLDLDRKPELEYTLCPYKEHLDRGQRSDVPDVVGKLVSCFNS